MIRRQMEGTRTALSEKLEKLENVVTEKVEEASSAVAETVEAVSETVENVTETVDETVDAVKHTLSLEWQAEHHPWMLVGGSVFLGYVAGSMLLRPRRPRWSEPPRQQRWSEPVEPERQPRREPVQDKHPEKSSGGFLGQLGSELGDLKSLGIGMAMGLLREVIRGAVPAAIGPQLSDAVNSLTEKIGGKPLGGAEPERAPTDKSSCESGQDTCPVI